MSKILKRTLTLVLTVCMLLSVVAITTPVAKAAEGDFTVDFQAAGNGDIRTLKGYDSTNKLSAISDADWAFLESACNVSGSAATAGQLSGGLSFTGWYSWYGGYSLAIVIRVPEAGYYDLTTYYPIKAGQKAGVRAAFKYIGEDATLADELYAKDITQTGNTYNNNFFASADFETKVHPGLGVQVTNQTGVAYNGNHELKEGCYVVLFTAWDFDEDNATSSNSAPWNDARCVIKSFKFTKSNPGEAKGLYTALTVAWPGGNAGVVNLMNNLDASLVDYELTRNDVDLDGNGTNFYPSVLNLNGLTATFKSFAVTGSRCVVTDTAGGGKIVTTGGQAPTFVDGQDLVAVKTAENTYTMFNAPTTAVKAAPVVTDGTATDYADGTSARFVFKATLEADALAAIAAGTQEVTVGATWKQGDKDLTPTTFDADSVVEWATGTNSTSKVFYIDVKGMDKLESGETVTCTPYITIGSVTKTLTPITYTAA